LVLVVGTGCGGFADLGGGGDPAPDAAPLAPLAPTSAQAELAASAVANSVMKLLSLGAAKPEAPPRLAFVASNTSHLTATVMTADCTARALPVVSSSPPYHADVEGSSSGGSGSASFSMEPGDGTMTASASFNMFFVPEETEDFAFNGTLDYYGTFTDLQASPISLTMNAASDGFELYDRLGSGSAYCDVVVNMHHSATVTVDAATSSAGYTRTVAGCLKFCGTSFEVSGSESGILQ
jgi:hypothetical protein